MKKITILLIAIWLGLGCGTIKKLFKNDSDGHVPLPPNPSEVQVDENGNPIFTDEQLEGQRPFNWTLTFLGMGFLITTALLVRGAIKKDD